MFIQKIIDTYISDITNAFNGGKDNILSFLKEHDFDISSNIKKRKDTFQIKDSHEASKLVFLPKIKSSHELQRRESSEINYEMVVESDTF